jgi:hypothetical protein
MMSTVSGGIGVTPYVPYSAIELVGNIQLTALVALIALAIIGKVVDGGAVSALVAKAYGVSLIVAFTVLVISTFVRIWLY